MYSAIGDEWLNYLGVSGSKNCTKNLDRPNQPIQSLLQQITLLLVGLADLARAVCPSYPYNHPSIQIYIHPSIYTSIHTFIQTSIHSKIHPKDLSTHTQQASAQKIIQCLGPTTHPDRTRCFWGFHLPGTQPASNCLTQNVFWKKYPGCFGRKLHTHTATTVVINLSQ